MSENKINFQENRIFNLYKNYLLIQYIKNIKINLFIKFLFYKYKICSSDNNFLK